MNLLINKHVAIPFLAGAYTRGEIVYGFRNHKVRCQVMNIINFDMHYRMMISAFIDDFRLVYVISMSAGPFVALQIKDSHLQIRQDCLLQVCIESPQAGSVHEGKLDTLNLLHVPLPPG